ncbi:MAG: phosphatase PAP2 family protein, partial [Patescibacteria group bacterium]
MVAVNKQLPSSSNPAMVADKKPQDSSQADSQKLKILAEVVSTLTNPAIIFVVSLGFITYRYADTTEQFLRWTVVGTLLLVGPGIIYTLTTWRKEKRVDIDISRREDRIVPMMLASLGALVGSYLISSRVGNTNLLLTSNILVAMLVSLTIITFQWKVSLHCATFAALTTLLAVFVNPLFSVMFGLIILIGWARFYLKQHTLAQVIGGSLVGTAVTALITILFNS